MKVVSIGREYMIYDDSLRTHDKLPAQSYYLRFSKMKGFYLEAQSNIDIKEDKVYGVHNEKIQKVLSGFNRSNRNFGVILSGHKGIGKSLFAKLLSKTAIDKGYPVIIIDQFIPGLAAILEDVQQEVVVLFDEFDKTFGNIKAADGEANPQDTLLSLFDGMSNGKKLFVVTCNSLRSLSDYLINRPGRFHYHFRFDFPSLTEIDEYMKDKLDSEYYDEIDKVKNFAMKVDLNYDCLRAIAFELNTGLRFEDAIRDLNIMNMDTERFSLTLHFENGFTMTNRRVSLDMFDKTNKCQIDMYDSKGRDIGIISFIPGDFQFDVLTGGNLLTGDKIDYKTYGCYEDDDDYEEMKALVPKYMLAVRERGKDLHYVV